jgi:Mycobacteriophage tail assembly protein
MAKMTLAELRKKADEKFGDLMVDKVVFRSILRLGDQRRKRASELLKQVSEMQSSEDRGDALDLEAITGVIRELLQLVATNQVAAKTLLDGLDGAELMTLMEEWSTVTQPGEASSSSS